MLFRVASIMEILATFFLVHGVCGKRFKFNLKSISAILSVLVIIEIINWYQLNPILLFGAYAIICLYAKNEFEISFVKALFNFIITTIVITLIQFVCRTIVELVVIEEEAWKSVIGSFFSLVISIFISYKSALYKLQKSITRKNTFLIPLFCFITVVILLILLQKKILHGIEIQYFVLAIPAIIMMLFMIVKWYKVKTASEELQKEILVMKNSQEDYSDLLVKVRLRQHEMKNHMAAVFSSHYTHKTYEKLVNAQEEYCNKLKADNKYNNLLLLCEPVLAGYLFGKFQEVEGDGIAVEYSITTRLDACHVPTYYLVEMMGILIDNAAEALKNSDDKKITFEIKEAEDKYSISIKNPYEYVPYEHIAEWFMLERSEKGRGRGLGLYHLKCLCDEWNCEIVCRNVAIEDINWIEFTLEKNKAENK